MSVCVAAGKMYSDSAFYEDPAKKYPTIEEQMKLCRLISNSLTSAANKRARGAKMFAKRKRRSTKWVHEGHSEWSSSAGDVANIDELESELDLNEGGSKQLFLFRIPNLKQRVASPERNTKMSMKKDEFERLRLQAQKCDHRVVSPGTCFDIVADLKASKGRGGRLFERRKNRADKFIIDESNAKLPGPKHTRLESLLDVTPLKSRQSPWEAAQSGSQGSVDAAFGHLSERERMQKLNQILQYSPPKPAMAAVAPREALQPLDHPVGPRTNLRSLSNMSSLPQGRNFNRYAKGWGGAGGGGGDERGTWPPLLFPFGLPGLSEASRGALCCGVLCCIVLCCVVVWCGVCVLCCVVLWCGVVCVLCCVAGVVLCCVVLCCVVL